VVNLPKELVGATGTSSVPVEVYIDGQGRVCRESVASTTKRDGLQASD
jgi:hypothetical protein